MSALLVGHFSLTYLDKGFAGEGYLFQLFLNIAKVQGVEPQGEGFSKICAICDRHGLAPKQLGGSRWTAKRN